MNNVAEEIPLIISDIEMPEMDGYTLTAEIEMIKTQAYQGCATYFVKWCL